MNSSLPDPGNPPRLAGSPCSNDSSEPRNEWLDSGKESTPRAPHELTELFEEVLQETSHALRLSLSANTGMEPLTAAEKQALNDAVRRLRGRSLPLETIVSELLFAVLDNNISDLPHFGAVGRALSERVARTLIDDPTAKLRLGSLWDRLQGEPA